MQTDRAPLAPSNNLWQGECVHTRFYATVTWSAGGAARTSRIAPWRVLTTFRTTTSGEIFSGSPPT